MPDDADFPPPPYAIIDYYRDLSPKALERSWELRRSWEAWQQQRGGGHAHRLTVGVAGRHCCPVHALLGPGHRCPDYASITPDEAARATGISSFTSQPIALIRHSKTVV